MSKKCLLIGGTNVDRGTNFNGVGGSEWGCWVWGVGAQWGCGGGGGCVIGDAMS